MIRTAFRLRFAPPVRVQRRPLSAKAIYSSFPASLVYYSPRQKSSLFDHKRDESRPDDLYDEGVIVAGDGLVYPSIDESVSNGAVMYPNIFTMQEYVRTYLDNFLDREEAGEEVEIPQIFTIPKGTKIPGRLILINEFLSRFSLQPSHGMSLKDLNQSLEEFFDKHAVKEKAGDWIDRHPFQSAAADNADAVWVTK